MAYKDIKKLILNSPAGDDKESLCYIGKAACKYNKFGLCIVCGGRKGRKFHKQQNITFQNTRRDKT